MTPGECTYQQFGLESDRVKGPKTKLWSDLSDDARAAWERIAKAAVNAYAEPLIPAVIAPAIAPPMVANLTSNATQAKPAGQNKPDVRSRAANDQEVTA